MFIIRAETIIAIASLAVAVLALCQSIYTSVVSNRKSKKDINAEFYSDIILNKMIKKDIPMMLNKLLGYDIVNEDNISEVEKVIVELRVELLNYRKSIAIYELYDNKIYTNISKCIFELDTFLVELVIEMYNRERLHLSSYDKEIKAQFINLYEQINQEFS